MEPNKRQNDTGKLKVIKRRKDYEDEDNPQLPANLEETFGNKKCGLIYEEQKQIELMISANDKDLSSLTKNNKNKITVAKMPEKEEIILTCYLYIQNNKQTIKKNINYIIGGIKFEVERISEQFIVINLINKEKDYKPIGIEKNARIMNFIDERQNYIEIHFIYSSTYLFEAMKDIKFESYYTISEELNSKKQKNSNDSDENSSDSTISFDSLSTIFKTDSIKNIYKFNNIKPIFSEENLNKKYVKKLEKLKDLSNNSKYYFKDINQNFYDFDKYSIAFYEIFQFACEEQTLVNYLYGPKFSSRSTFLIFSRNLFKNFKVLSLYLDANCLKSKDNLKRKKIISHELLYLFDNIEEMEMIEKKKIFHGLPCNKENILHYIYFFLKNLFEAIKPIKNDKRIVIIIDNIIDKDNNLNNVIEDILSLQKSNRIKFVLCGNGKYFNQKFIELYQSDSIQTYDRIRNAYILSNDKQYKEFLNEFLKYSLKFSEIYENNQSKEEFEEKIINYEKEYLDIYHFSGIFFGEELINKIIKKEDIENKNKNIFFEIPFEYFEIKINKDNNELSFSFFHPAFQKSIKKKIELEVKCGTLTRLLRDKDFPRTFFGICFEKKITLLLMNNKFNLNNLIFDEKNIKEIDKITDLKESNYKGPLFDLENKEEPILLLQKNFFGPNYYLLILSRILNNEIYANFVQIGEDKKKDMIEKILKDLYDNIENYKKNISVAFGLESGLKINITLLFIFDLDTQKQFNFSSGVKICVDNKIDYYLFSNDSDNLWICNGQNNNLVKLDFYIPRNINLKAIIEDMNKKEESQENKNSLEKKKRT